MICPVCVSEMIEEDFGGINVDVCKNGCRGIWFDWAEIVKLDENNEGFGSALEAALKFPKTNEENRGNIQCPKCGIPMHIHKYKSSKEINVDECYVCGGFFLDSGEFNVIRDTFMSEEEEEQYNITILKDIPSYQGAQIDLEKEKMRAKAIRRYTRFIRLSYYMTGK
ncbi:zf-TFIIB domain-containing protein [Candidatus Latescibacterota bacterium]